MTESSKRASFLWWGFALALLTGTIGLLLWSGEFRHGEGYEDRPIGAVVLALAGMSIVYAAAVWLAHRRPPSLRFVLGVALLLRGVMIGSMPIQEDDLYRYIWDGKVVASGVDPYRYSPDDIQQMSLPASEDLKALHAIYASSDANRVIVERINNGSFVTIYPVVAQGVFAFAAVLTPEQASVERQVITMKATLALFELLALIGVLLIARGTAHASVVLLSYAWCPLVIKEIYNSGHMDTIPIALSVWAIVFVLRSAMGQQKRFVVASGLALGLACGAKFYPLLLAPLVFAWLWRRRSSWLWSVGFLLVAGGIVLLSPEGGGRRGDTLKYFALGWEMNAPFFYWVERVISVFSQGVEMRIEIDSDALMFSAAKVYARYFCGVLIAGLVLWRGILCFQRAEMRELLNSAFLVLIGLCFLGPIGFPWYYLWCVPFIAFAGGGIFALLPLCLSVYNLRFAIDYRPASYGFASSELGIAFFDEVITSLEFLPLLMASVVVWIWRVRQTPKTLLVVAGAIEHEGRYLVGRRDSGERAGLWEFPGGKVEPGESFEDALSRELHEEIALRVDVGDTIEHAEEGGRSGRLELHLLHARADRTQGLASTSHSELAWLRIDEILALPLCHLDRVLAKRLRS